MMSERKQTNENELESWEVPLEDELALKQWLNQSILPEPDPSMMQQTINTVTLDWHLRKERTKQQYLLDLLRLTKTELYFFSPFYWLTTIGSFLFALILSYFYTNDWYAVSFFVAPLIFVVSLTELMRSRNNRMTELEMSFTFNSKQVFLAKLTVINSYNLLLNGLFSLTIYWVEPTINMTSLLLIWWIPFIVISSLSLIITTLFRHASITHAIAIIWLVFCIMDQSSFHLVDWLLAIPTSILVTIMLGAILLYFSQIRYISTHWKGWITYETRIE
ncbi:hypothetical protein [Paenibacillus yanchengensis]|uniref:Uncharacterized protein n=1 Tax=Paenibacillus yanchengensis TaxID=2035833 RepID=A0ABW4YLE0_9BACL